MKLLTAFVLTMGAVGPVLAVANVGISIGIHQPGAYGRIDIDNYPSPELVYAQPVVISPQPMSEYQRPIYLYVPTAHQQNWGRYCGRYRACGQPVYFVQDQWVRERYQQERERAPQYMPPSRRGRHVPQGQWHDREHENRGHDRDDRREH
jgi:hypothetical protein